MAIRDSFPFIGLGAVIRNHNGEIIAAISKPWQGSFCAEVGEYLALREGLILAKKFNLTVKLAEVDAVNVANGVNLSDKVNYQFTSIYIFVGDHFIYDKGDWNFF